MRHYGKDKIVVDDEDEFEEHKVKFKYPEDLINTCIEEVKVVKKLMLLGNGLFSDKAFDWRPDKELPYIIDLNSGYR